MAGKKQEMMSNEDFLADVPETWLEEATGFAPYWVPEVGKKFRAMVLDIDTNDPTFHRYILQNTGEEAITCQRGPAADAEEVEVMPGEQFTCSAYASLDLGRFLGEEVMLVTFGNRKLPANEASDGKPRDLWVWKILVSPDTKKRLAARRAEEGKMLREAAVRARVEGAAVLGVGRRNSRSLPATQNNSDAE